MPRIYIRIITLVVLAILLQSMSDCYAQSRRERRQERRAAQNQPLQIPGLSGEGFKVSAGQKTFDNAPRQSGTVADSLAAANNMQLPDSLRLLEEGAQLVDSMRIAGAEVQDVIPVPKSPALSRREQRRLELAQARLDTMNYRHHPMFRDTMKMGTNFAISLVAPGFQQFYNRQYWKIPVLYATAGTALYFGIRESRIHRVYRKDYDYLISVNASRTDIDPIQTKMLQHSARRNLFMFAALGSYIYFLGDGMLNYPTESRDRIQTATLLSTICPGAGQIYNESYWRAPVFLGMGAATIYIIDFNNRGYQRYKTAYQYRTDGNDSTVDEFVGRLDDRYILNLKQSYRRNRDLAIILTGFVYLLNIMDAHVDAHLNTFDISDDLSYTIKLDPVITPIYTYSRGMDAMVGFNVSIKF